MQEIVSAKAPEEADTFVLPRVDMEKVHKREAKAVEVRADWLSFLRDTRAQQSHSYLTHFITCSDVVIAMDCLGTMHAVPCRDCPGLGDSTNCRITSAFQSNEVQLWCRGWRSIWSLAA